MAKRDDKQAGPVPMTRGEWALIHHALTQLKVVGRFSLQVRAAVAETIEKIGPDGYHTYSRGTRPVEAGQLQEATRGV